MFDPQHLHRVYRRLGLARVPFVPGLLYRLNRLLTACDLPPSVRLGRGVRFQHWGPGVAICPHSIVGDEVLFLPQSRVIADPAAPEPVRIVIGNQVQLSAGSVVLASGRLEIGDRAQIGAGALVRSSVPADAVAIGCDDVMLRRRHLPSPPSRYEKDSRPLLDPVKLQKISYWFYARRIPWVPGVFYRLNYLVNRCMLSANTYFGHDVRIGRWVMLNPLSTNGDRAIFRPGAITARKIRSRHPQPLELIVIGRDVEIGPAAIVVGEGVLEVADGAVVEEGAVVTRPVPRGCTVAGAPARVVGRPIAFALLHCDYYESVKRALAFVARHAAPGAVAFVNDYGSWPGSTKATDEFLAANGGRVSTSFTNFGQPLLRFA